MPIKGAANNQSLHVSTIPPKDLSTARYRCVKVPVQTSSITPIHVYMDRQSDLINLTRNFVEFKVGFKTMGNANLTSHADAVATMHIPANIAYTLFKQINCRANGTLLTERLIFRLYRTLIEMMERPFSNAKGGGMKSILQLPSKPIMSGLIMPISVPFLPISRLA